MMESSRLFHLQFDPTQYRAAYAILPGDPARTGPIAEAFQEQTLIASNREYTVRLARQEGRNILICSTGIGGPSAAIAVEELYHAGVRTFLRVGTCGGIQPYVLGGDLVVATGAVRQEGASRHYAPDEYPPVADFFVTRTLVEAARATGKQVHVGVVQSKDSFYGQHDPERMPVAAQLLEKWEAWKRLGVLASEMECAALFTVAASLGAKAGAVLQVLWNQERANAGLSNPEATDASAAVQAATAAVKALLHPSAGTPSA